MDPDSKQKNLIMISYRREDSAGVTGRIYDRLIQKFGKEEVFKDVDSIPLGINFRKYIDSVVSQCSVLIAVIGDEWLVSASKAGKRRLDDPRDLVRVEIESALKRSIPVIPLLVQGASMPRETDLPGALQELAHRNGTTVGHDPHFHPDMDRLIKNLETLRRPHKFVDAYQEAVSKLSEYLKTNKQKVQGRSRYGEQYIWTNGHLFEIASTLPPALQKHLPIKDKIPGLEQIVEGLQKRMSLEFVPARQINPSSGKDSVELTSDHGVTSFFLNPTYHEYLRTRYPDAEILINETHALFVSNGKLIAGVMGKKV